MSIMSIFKSKYNEKKKKEYIISCHKKREKNRHFRHGVRVKIGETRSPIVFGLVETRTEVPQFRHYFRHLSAFSLPILCQP